MTFLQINVILLASIGLEWPDDVHPFSMGWRAQSMYDDYDDERPSFRVLVDFGIKAGDKSPQAYGTIVEILEKPTITVATAGAERKQGKKPAVPTINGSVIAKTGFLSRLRSIADGKSCSVRVDCKISKNGFEGEALWFAFYLHHYVTMTDYLSRVSMNNTIGEIMDIDKPEIDRKQLWIGLINDEGIDPTTETGQNRFQEAFLAMSQAHDDRVDRTTGQLICELLKNNKVALNEELRHAISQPEPIVEAPKLVSRKETPAKPVPPLGTGHTLADAKGAEVLRARSRGAKSNTDSENGSGSKREEVTTNK